MTGRPSRGRGRPPVIDEPLATKLFALLADGALLKDAAAACRVEQRTINNTSRRDPAFGAALTAAKTAGRQVRIAAMPHNESHYNNYDCRHPDCIAAATKGRAGRARNRGRTPNEEPPAGEVIDLPRAGNSPPPLLVWAS